jgi:hypothetical protein
MKFEKLSESFSLMLKSYIFNGEAVSKLIKENNTIAQFLGNIFFMSILPIILFLVLLALGQTEALYLVGITPLFIILLIGLLHIQYLFAWISYSIVSKEKNTNIRVFIQSNFFLTIIFVILTSSLSAIGKNSITTTNMAVAFAVIFLFIVFIVYYISYQIYFLSKVYKMSIPKSILATILPLLVLIFGLGIYYFSVNY